MFSEALFTIAKMLKKLKCLPTDEWIKNTWCVCVCVCVCILQYYSAMIKKQDLPFAIT